jgi:hypothetical protein
MASAAQKQKFAKFGKLGDADQIIAVLKGLVVAGGLTRASRGRQWGVTVCPDKYALMRLNAGNRCHADVVDLNGYWHLRLYVIAPLLNGTLDPKFKVTAGTRAAIGFREVPNSLELRIPLQEATETVANAAHVADAFREHINYGSRKDLPNAAWHNSLVDQLLDN